MLKKLERIFRQSFPKRLKKYTTYLNALKDLNGLEIGGPSFAFSTTGFLPLYDTVANLDGCNFSSNTMWEGNIKEGNTYAYGNKKGYQYISDGIQLEHIKDGHYDFILSSHSIEHFANPLKALSEWKRVIREGGYMVLIVPHKDNTFDRNRPITTLDHLIMDYENNTGEDDSTHFEEVLSLHDITMDNGIGDMEALKLRTIDNYNNRGVHHHVFNTPLVVKIANHLNFKICDVQVYNPFHIVLLLQKSDTAIPDNSYYLNPNLPVYHQAKFPSDKIW
jgi:SAM-dependent methyltransferase